MPSAYRLMRVTVPAAFTKKFTVPEFEVPVLEALWSPHVSKPIDVLFLGSHTEGPDPRDFPAVAQKFEELQRNYRHPEGTSAAEQVFGAVAGFRQQLQSLVKSGPGPMDKLIENGGPEKEPAATRVERGVTAVHPDDDSFSQEDGEDEDGEEQGHDDLESMAPHLPPLKRNQITAALREAGVTDADAILAMSDEDLLPIKWVTDKTLPKIREAAQKVVDGL